MCGAEVEKSKPPNGRRSNAGQARVHICDRRKKYTGKGARSPRTGSQNHWGETQRLWTAFPRKGLRSEYARRSTKMESLVGESVGGIAAKSFADKKDSGSQDGSTEGIRASPSPFGWGQYF